MKKIFSIILICMILGKHGICQDILATHSIKPVTGTIGDVFDYEITVTYNLNQKLIQPSIKKKLNEFSVLDYRINNTNNNKKNVYQLKYKLAVYETGKYFIPTQNIKYITKNNKRKKKTLLPILVQIKSVLSKQNENVLIDIKPPYHLKRDWSWLYLIIFILLIFICSYYLLNWYRKRKNKTIQNEIPKQFKKNPEEIALEKIEILITKKLIENRKTKQHYYELSIIIKEYLANKFKYKIVELTTEETISFLSKETIDPETLKRINKFLNFCDQVKFAKYQPTENEHKEYLDRAKEIIKRIGI